MEKVRVKLEHIPGVKTASFLGKRFQILFGRVSGKLGGCNGRNEKKRVLFLDDRLSGKQLFDTALHEAIHACFDKRLNEKQVQHLTRDLSRFLYRISR